MDATTVIDILIKLGPAGAGVVLIFAAEKYIAPRRSVAEGLGNALRLSYLGCYVAAILFMGAFAVWWITDKIGDKHPSKMTKDYIGGQILEIPRGFPLDPITNRDRLFISFTNFGSRYTDLQWRLFTTTYLPNGPGHNVETLLFRILEQRNIPKNRSGKAFEASVDIPA